MRRVSLKQYLLEAVIRAVLPLLGVMMLMSGLLGVVSFTVVPVVDAMRSRQWTPVAATLEWARVEPPAPGRIRPLPALEVRYSYRFAGADFVGQRNDLHFGLNSAAAVQRRLREIEDGRALVVWVNPEAPTQAMLDRSLHWGVMVWTLPSALFALVGGLLVFVGMVAWNDWRPLWRREALPESAAHAAHAAHEAAFGPDSVR